MKGKIHYYRGFVLVPLISGWWARTEEDYSHIVPKNYKFKPIYEGTIVKGMYCEEYNAYSARTFNELRRVIKQYA